MVLEEDFFKNIFINGEEPKKIELFEKSAILDKVYSLAKKMNQAR